MNLRLYLLGLFSAILLSLGLWFLLLLNVNPYQAPTWIIAIFYFAFFIFFFGVFAVSGFYLKVWASNREVIFSHLLPTLRQAAVLSLMITGIAFLQQIKALNWWVASLYIVSLIMLELFFRSKK